MRRPNDPFFSVLARNPRVSQAPSGFSASFPCRGGYGTTERREIASTCQEISSAGHGPETVEIGSRPILMLILVEQPCRTRVLEFPSLGIQARVSDAIGVRFTQT